MEAQISEPTTEDVKEGRELLLTLLKARESIHAFAIKNRIILDSDPYTQTVQLVEEWAQRNALRLL